MSYSGIRTLVVDDLDYVRNSVCSLLKEIGVQDVLQASNGRLAFEKVVVQYENETPIQVILCDIHMPQSDGFEFLQAMRSDDRFKDIPIIMVSSETSIEIIKKVIECGANNYLLKPFTPQSLEEKFVSALGNMEAV